MLQRPFRALHRAPFHAKIWVANFISRKHIIKIQQQHANVLEFIHIQLNDYESISFFSLLKSHQMSVEWINKLCDYNAVAIELKRFILTRNY